MIKANINVTNIDKKYLHKGEKGIYLGLTFMDNRDGTDQYGNDGFIVQDIPQAARESGERGEIVGNWKTLKPKAQAPAPKPQPKQLDDDGDEIPF
jgi:hypothetical protein